MKTKNAGPAASPDGVLRSVAVSRIIAAYRSAYGRNPSGSEVRHILPTVVADLAVLNDRELIDRIMREAPVRRNRPATRRDWTMEVRG